VPCALFNLPRKSVQSGPQSSQSQVQQYRRLGDPKWVERDGRIEQVVRSAMVWLAHPPPREAGGDRTHVREHGKVRAGAEPKISHPDGVVALELREHLFGRRNDAVRTTVVDSRENEALGYPVLAPRSFRGKLVVTREARVVAQIAARPMYVLRRSGFTSSNT